ncbi:fimbria/pilus outer membrane usher protein [Photobacterium leiognathi]|uniref:fimbria/pilus outer membrane usher protein n=1 Tax=Photobacterium leiognathi TaxID=553611 RepID=UPI002981781F|nr:fimbria/pilus outer membrane usher protein [Photobacterium leiognathi]
MKVRYSLFLSLTVIFQANYARADLDLSFIQGKDVKAPDFFKNKQTNIPGKYFVDVFLNNEKFGNKIITITKKDSDSICLSKNWIENIKLPVNFNKINNVYISNRHCFDFNQIQGGSVKFDFSQQSLNINLPQAVLKKNSDNDVWDYGVPGFRLNYAINGNKVFSNGRTNSEYLYGDFDLHANYGKWVLSVVTRGMSSEGFTSPDMTLSTAIKPLKSKLSFGKDYTETTIFPNFPFYGASIHSDLSMESWTDRGYAPVINGVLNSNSRITIKQDGYILYSKILPAGPYSLTDIDPIFNGDLSVITEEANGNKTMRVYPVTTASALLRENKYHYNISAGMRDKYDNRLDGAFVFGSFDYGFNTGTLNTAAIIHNKYQSLGYGYTLPISEFGIISTSINVARSKFNKIKSSNEHDQKGTSIVLQYSKYFGKNTNVKVLNYRYVGKGYNDFSSFDPNSTYTKHDKSTRYQAVISQQVGSFSLNTSGWFESHQDVGGNISISGTIGDINLMLSAGYSNYKNTNSNYNTSFNVNIPLDFWNKTQYLNSSVNYTEGTGVSINNGMSVDNNDGISYDINLNMDKNQKMLSLYTSKSFSSVEAGMSISKSNNTTAISTGFSGSIAGAKNVGIAYSNQQEDTLAIAHISNLKDITFNGRSPTNSFGNSLIPLSNYQDNHISIDTDNIPDNISLVDSAYNFIPTENAIVVRDFKYIKVSNYFLRILSREGKPFPMGTQVKTSNGDNVGFIALGGVLVATLVSPEEYLKISDSKDTCKIKISNIKANKNKVIDVHCK